MVVGLLFVRYINEIAAGLAWLTGQPVFDPVDLLLLQNSRRS